MLSDLPKVTQLLNARGKTKTLIIHVHPMILTHSLGLRERPIWSLMSPSFFQCRTGDTCDCVCLRALKVPSHGLLCKPHLPDGETELSAPGGGGGGGGHPAGSEGGKGTLGLPTVLPKPEHPATVAGYSTLLVCTAHSRLDSSEGSQRGWR